MHNELIYSLFLISHFLYFNVGGWAGGQSLLIINESHVMKQRGVLRAVSRSKSDNESSCGIV